MALRNNPSWLELNDENRFRAGIRISCLGLQLGLIGLNLVGFASLALLLVGGESGTEQGWVWGWLFG